MSTLADGDRLGPYEILGALGAGGMGEVYRARDTRLGRVVAIKVLAPEWHAAAGGRERFEREARSIAALSHPQICTLHEIGDHEGRTYLVMELLEGQTLSRRLDRAPAGLPLDEALATAAPIAEALAFAHQRGVVHRDVKPGNIMLTPVGVKLLDFGLARLVEPGGNPSAESTAATAGFDDVVAGTLAYMSPEQLDGRADSRSDIFAFGAVLFEMLTGRQAFRGETASAVIGAIVQGDPPPVTSLRPQVSPALDRVVRRCLAKDPHARWQSAADLADELRWLAGRTSAPDAAASSHVEPSRRGRLALAALAALAAVAGIAYIAGAGRTAPPPARLTQLAFSLPPGVGFPFFTPGVALSPDGTTVVFAAGRGSGMIESRTLFVKRLDSSDVQAVPGTDGATYPFFSADGTAVGFFADRKLKQWVVATGSVSVIADLPGDGQGAAAIWTRDGTILFGEHSDRPAVGIRRVTVSDGAVQTLTRPDNAQGEQTHFGAQLVPGTDTMLYTVRSNGSSGIEFRVDARRGDGELARAVIPGASLARYIGDGRLVYQIGNDLMVAAFDPATLAVTNPRRLLSGVAGTFSGPAWAVAGDTLVYQPRVAGRRRLVWVDREGHAVPLATPVRDYQNPRLSPRGDRAALTIQDGTRNDVWTVDLAQQTMAPLTADGLSGAGVWSQHGSEYLIRRANGTALDIVAYRVDDTASGRLVLQTGEQLYAADLAADQRTLIVMKPGASTGADLWTADLAGGGPLRPLVQTPAQEWGGRLSPDGRWLAYFSNVSGRFELFVSPFPGGGPRRQVSRDGAREAVWSPDGRELFFRNGDQMLVAALKPGDGFAWEPPRVLFSGAFFQQGGPGNAHYDVAPDGQRFLMIEEATPVPPALHVVQGWPLLR